MKNAVGYIRVSTEAQGGEDRYGIAAQRKAIEAYAAEHEYDIVKWYCDEVSGCCENPPELNKVLFGDDVENPPYEAVIAFKSDRIARDTKLYFYRLYLLEKKGVALISTLEEFDDRDGFANVYRAMMMFVAEQERKNITLRTSNGRRIKSGKGGYSGGSAPFGYDVKDGNLVINDDEAAIVRRIFEDRDNGESLDSIVYWLNHDNIQTRKGKGWHRSSVKYILDNRKTYEGYYRYGKDGEWVNGEHEPILKQD